MAANSINSKQIIVTAIILMLFAVIGGGMVAMTQQGTAERIQENERLALLRSLNAIVPAEEYDNQLTQSVIDIPANDLLNTRETWPAYLATKAGKTIAVIFNSIAPDGYNGRIQLLIGVYTDGRIAGVRVVSHRETPGLGDAIEADRSDWILGFDNKSLQQPTEKGWKVKRDGGEFDQFTGATITPRAVVKAVQNTLLYFQQHRQQLLATQPAG